MENLTYSSNLHVGSGIVAALKRYGQVTVPFLANALHRRPEELEAYLTPLEHEGVISRNGDTVKIVDEEG